MPFDAIIFDCDGTLVDSEPLSAATFAEAVTELGLPMTAQDAIDQFTGRDMRGCLDDVAARYGGPLPDDFEANLRERMDAAFVAHLRPIDGALGLIRDLTIPFAIASNGPQAKMRRTLNVTGLIAHFEGRIHSAYDVERWKPDPGVFLAAAAALGAEPRRCAVVEDSGPGIAAGLAAGMTVFAFRPRGPVPVHVHAVQHLDELRPRFGMSG